MQSRPDPRHPRTIVPPRPNFGSREAERPAATPAATGRTAVFAPPWAEDDGTSDAAEPEPQAPAITPFWPALGQNIVAGAMAATGFYVFIAAASRNPTDDSANAAGFAGATAPHNWLGAAGAATADLAVQTFGVAAILLALLSIAGGVWRIARGYRAEAFTSGKAVLAALGALSLAPALSALPSPARWEQAAGLGGNFGDIALAGLAYPLDLIGAPGAAPLMGLAACLFAVWALARAFELKASEMFEIGAAALGAAQAATLSGARWIETQFARSGRGGEAIGHPSAPAPSGEDPTPEPARARVARPFFGPAHDGPAEDDETLAEAEFPAADEARAGADRAPAALPPEGKSAPGLKTNAPKPAARRLRRTEGFELPHLNLLAPPKPRRAFFDESALLARAERLKSAFVEFRVRGEISEIRPGPVVTLFEFEPGPGVRTAQVTSVGDDIARSMGVASARIAIVPGKNALGVELPNDEREMVSFQELLAADAYRKSEANLPLALGQTIGGDPFVADLARMPHLLIAGTTGSGKSVGINSMILSLLYRLTPDQCRFIMIDPKKLELSVYEGIPHLLTPVVTEPKQAVAALKWAVREMEERYLKMSLVEVRSLAGFNEKAAAAKTKGVDLIGQKSAGVDEDGAAIIETVTIPAEILPFIVVVIDEMADLMLVAGKDIETAVQRLAQMARAAGIHVIMATQRPSVDVITGTIKANFPTRISFQVASKIDSRTIINEMGAEQLLGQGDMLFVPGSNRMRRLHGPFVSDAEVRDVVSFLRAQGAPRYVEEVTAEPDESGAPLGGESAEGDDKLYAQAVDIVLRDRKPSGSYLQRRLGVGYNRGADLIERMERDGIVSAPNASGKREILIGRE